MDYKLHNHQADLDAAHDLTLEDARKSVVITGYEFGECLPCITDGQYQQFCGLVVDSTDERLQHMVQLICADVIARKAKQVMGVKK